MYNKIFTKILDSSVWLEPTPIRIVWITLLAAMDEDGFCSFAAVGNVAGRARVTIEEARNALEILASPDPESSDPDNEGRRIERVSGGWIVLNATKYRELVSRANAQEKTRERVRRFREKSSSNGHVTPCNASETVGNDPVTPSEAYTETETIDTSSLFSKEDIQPKPDFKKEVISKVWEYYRQQFDRNENYCLSPTRQKHAEKAWDALVKKCKQNLVAEADQPEIILGWFCKAIERMRKDKYHNGQNDQHMKYNDWDYLFRGKDYKSPDKLTDFWLNDYKFSKGGNIE